MKNKFLFSVFVYFIILVLLSLGFWQLYRLNWKLDLINQIENSLKIEPIELKNVEKKNYLRIKTSGQIDFEKQIYPLRELGALELIEGRTEIIKDVFSLPANGHTPGHQCLCLETQDDEKIILTGDLFHNEAQINEQFWCPIFDWNTMMSTISRVGLLNSAYKNQWIVCTGHLSDEKAIGRIKSNNDGFYWQPI